MLDVPAVTPVIHVKDAYKFYGSVQVLGGITMSVQPGTIYGLLGPSGCGKTTLMNCIVGSNHIDSGTIQFSFSEHKDLGFMPQEISLHTYLSIKEVMIFYGYLFSMDDEKIRERAKLLSEMLDLPPLHKMVSNLSGGQQRRVSLAVALLHDPKVLILDEPTVGLDPVLSSALWDRLQEMSQAGKTIIITTHYIEEARQANMIGLMRNGRMLREDSPNALLQRYNAEYLEDVFLVLCAQDNEASKNIQQVPAINYSKSTTFESSKTISYERVKALVWKNICLAKRNFLMTLFIILLPIVLNCCVELAYGHDPVGLPIGFINKEFQDSLQRCPLTYTNNCVLANDTHWASCAFIHELREKSYEMREYADIEKAVEDYEKKRIWSIVSFASNYTESLTERVKLGTQSEGAVIEAGTVLAHISRWDHLMYTFLVRDFYMALNRTIENSLQSCSSFVSPGALRSPMQMNTPVYGGIGVELIVHFIMGFNIITILFCPMVYSCACILDEKEQGVIDRVLCCGATMRELLASHLFLQLIMLIVHCIELYIVTYSIFSNPLEGSSFFIIVMLAITALTGALAGTVLGLVTEHLMLAVNLGVSFNFIMAYTSGLFWPLQGAHPAIRDYLPYLPITGTITAARSISLKGHGLKNLEVIGGLISNVGWCLAMAVLLLITVKTWKGPWNSKK
ncbi:unnamed protein product [Bemisia tabaci]|uniref:ABC transporter domain-containing protein n=2 Tax=Bemisia tabaci TaxID=7038 RepID=A0A9P0A8X8_BEMTA|nr:unnamed protein product [Bemisia tabaci]